MLFYVLATVFTSIIYIINLFISEINLGYTWDSPMYCAVARGMLNGIAPYSGLYENKPICVFLLHALSFLLTDNVIIVNIFMCFSLLIIGFMPFICILKYMKKESKGFSNHQVILYSMMVLISGFLIMNYAMKSAEYFEPEILGASFICLYFWAIMHINWKKGEKVNKKSLIIWTLLAAIFAMGGVMTKEPFAIIAVAGGLLLTESIRDFISKIVIPMCIGAVFSITLLFATGTLSGYFSIYIKNMFGNHISYYGSPFQRILDINKILTNIIDFNLGLFLIILVSILIIIIRIFTNRNFKLSLRIWKICSIIIIIFATSFSIGLGGHYFPHHFVLAVPIYTLLIIEGCKALTEIFVGKKLKTTLVLIFSVFIYFIYFTNTINSFEISLNLSKFSQNMYYSSESQAKYVDAMLDYYDEDTYQFLGFNNTSYTFYGLTKHSPKGPVFVQDSYNFEDENNWFSQNLIKQLDEVNIVILDKFNMPAINDKVKKILDTEFTTKPKDKFTEMQIPNGFEIYTVYYRTGTH